MILIPDFSKLSFSVNNTVKYHLFYNKTQAMAHCSIYFMAFLLVQFFSCNTSLKLPRARSMTSWVKITPLKAASMPIPTETEISGKQIYGGGGDGDDDDDAALIRRIQAEVMAESGVELDQLINPGKVVNLERELIALTAQLGDCTDSEEKLKLQEKYEKATKTLSIEKRAVMRGWLKGLFVGQSVLAGVLSFAMVYDLFPDTHLPLAIQVLGFWMWWLFIIPSLRARKPSNEEKEALNIAFLASPAVSLLMPTFTKDVAIIWWVNLVTMAACYAYAYSKPKQDPTMESLENSNEENSSVGMPTLLLKALKALDYGSGQERGSRK